MVLVLTFRAAARRWLPLLAVALVCPSAAYAREFDRLVAAPPPAGDDWARFVASKADYETIARSLGKPRASWISVIEVGERPLQVPISIATPDDTAPGSKPVPRIVVRVMAYDGRAGGLDYLVVLHEDRTLYAVAPPTHGERTLDAVRKSHGSASLEKSGTAARVADLHGEWDLHAVPGKNLAFVTRPGGAEVLARVIYR